MTELSPNLIGFAEAQQRLRDKLGFDIRFYAPIAGSYPPGTRLNPETGKPFDPTIKPTGSGWASASVKCSVVSRPMGPHGVDQTETTALGIMDSKTVGVIMGSGAFTGVVAEATEFDYLDRRFKIRDDQADELGIRDRHVVIGDVK